MWQSILACFGLVALFASFSWSAWAASADGKVEQLTIKISASAHEIVQAPLLKGAATLKSDAANIHALNANLNKVVGTISVRQASIEADEKITTQAFFDVFALLVARKISSITIQTNKRAITLPPPPAEPGPGTSFVQILVNSHGDFLIQALPHDNPASGGAQIPAGRTIASLRTAIVQEKKHKANLFVYMSCDHAAPLAAIVNMLTALQQESIQAWRFVLISADAPAKAQTGPLKPIMPESTPPKKTPSGPDKQRKINELIDSQQKVLDAMKKQGH
jgi:biopolymer transport protein ExbD